MFQSLINLDQLLCLKLIKYNIDYYSSGILMPIQDIVNSFIGSCRCGTELFPLDPTSSETNTKNENPLKRSIREVRNRQNLFDCQELPGRGK